MLPAAFLDRPIAHRAFHDTAQGRPENSRVAIVAAVAAGYGIEIDIQSSADGRAMVFHDYDLGRVTPEKGPIAQRSAEDLAQIPLLHSDEGIPGFTEVLNIVAGRVPLLVEIKDQDGAMGKNIGPLEQAVATALEGYGGDVALMSFNPHSVAALARYAPDRPRGITTCDYAAKDWQLLNEATRSHLATIPDFDRTGACFISHAAGDLTSPHVAALKSRGVPVLCWTIRSPEAEAEARKIADNITFEGYAAA